MKLRPLVCLKFGVTLAELMIATVIISVVLLASVKAMRGVAQGVILNRARTGALTVAEGKINELRAGPYVKVYVATTTSVIPGLPVAVSADLAHFPVETAPLNGINYQRYVFVEKVLRGAGDTYQTVANNVPDTGIRRVFVTVVWPGRDGLRHITQSSVIENRYTKSTNVGFQGTVRDSALATLAGVQIIALEDPARRGYTDASGFYSFNVRAGTYTLMATLPGYFPTYLGNCYVDYSTSPVTKNFTMVGQSSGTLSGALWKNDHLVISRVVGSSLTTVSGFDQEFVEVFNPTTWSWTMNGNIGLSLQRPTDGAPQPIDLVYVTATLLPFQHYLFANAPNVTIQGAVRAADAYWDPTSAGNAARFPYFASDQNVIPIDADGGGTEGSAAIALVAGAGIVLDRLGWQKGAAVPPFFSGAPLPDAGGLQADETYERHSSTNGVSALSGPAYDPDQNADEFSATLPVPSPARNHASGPLPILAGTPAVGAYVFATDRLSLYTQAVLTAGPPYFATYTLTGVATGTWTTMASSGSFYEDGVVAIAAGSNTSLNMILDQTNTFGFVSGQVKDAGTMSPLAGIIVSPAGVVTDAGGNYRMAVSEGTQFIVANPQPMGTVNYVTSGQNVSVQVGQLTGNVDFFLSAGVRLRGRMTSGVGLNPVPDVPFVAVDINTGQAADEEVSNANGYFELQVPTGTYNVYSLDPNMFTPGGSGTSSTGTYSVPGATVFLSTFTMNDGIWSRFEGRLTDNGVPIKGGVLLMAVPTTLFIGALPPDLPPPATLGPYYFGHVYSDGTYRIHINTWDYGVFTNWDIHAWYTKNTGSSRVVVQRAALNRPAPSGATGIVDIAW